jgi:two-component system sensor histidine kinase RegB
VTLGIHKRGKRVAFEVEDHGHGMDEETLRRAGEPFFTTKAPGKGMGLGLFLVKLVAEKFGGSFKLHSRPGEGTRSVLELPDAS